jgi:hypothetical protein
MPTPAMRISWLILSTSCLWVGLQADGTGRITGDAHNLIHRFIRTDVFAA